MPAAPFGPSATIKEGYLHVREAEEPALLPRFAFKKRYFWLSTEALSYSKSPEWQVGAARALPTVPPAGGGAVGAVTRPVSGSPGALLHPRAADAGGGARGRGHLPAAPRHAGRGAGWRRAAPHHLHPVQGAGPHPAPWGPWGHPAPP